MTDRLLLLAVSVAAIASCARSRDATLVVARDSAGIEIVESSQGASSKAPPRLSLSVEPTLQIGSRGGQETALHRVVGTTRLADGRIVVANAGTGELRAFSPAGEFLYAAGKAGDAPGEFLGLAAMHQTGSGDLLAYDYRAKRISVFGDDLTLRRTSSLSDLPVAREGLTPYPVPVGWLDSGALVLRQDFYPTTESLQGSEALVVRQPTSELHLVDSDGRTISKAGSWPGTKSVMRIARGDAGRLSIATVLVPFMKHSRRWSCTTRSLSRTPAHTR